MTTSLSLAHQRKNKQTNKNSPYTKLVLATGQTLGEQKPKERKNSTLKTGRRKPQTQVKTNNNEKAAKYYTNAGTN